MDKRDQEIWEANKMTGDHLLALLGRYFGTVAVRQLSWEDLDGLYRIVEAHGRAVAQIADNHSNYARYLDAQMASLNILKATLAGQAAERRNLTGEEPAPEIVGFIMGSDAEGGSHASK